MLGNGYKERLANAQNSLGSLLLNLSKQQQINGSLSPTTSSSSLLDNSDPGVESSSSLSPFKQSFASKLAGVPTTTVVTPVSMPPAPAPALESNSSSRHSSVRQQQQQQQQQQTQQDQQQRRTSRLPNAGFSLGRLSDHQFPELGSQTESNSGSRHSLGPSSGITMMDDVGGLHLEPSFTNNTPFHNSRSPSSRWDGSTSGGGSSTAATSVYNDGHCTTPLSNSPPPPPVPSFVTGTIGNRNIYQLSSQQSQYQCQQQQQHQQQQQGLNSSEISLQAVLILQRAIRRFLLLKRHAKVPRAQTTSTTNASLLLAKDYHPTGSKALNSPLPIITNHQQHQQQQQQSDFEALQQTCLRQSAEINQLKEMMTRLLLEAEEDRRKLRQRDQEVEELLMKQQKILSSSVTPPPPTSTSSQLLPPPIQTSGFDSTGLAKSANRFSTASSTANTFNTYNLSGESSPALMNNGPMTDEDYYDLASYANATSVASIHPLAVSSRSNSIHSVHSNGAGPGLKISSAVANAYNSYQGGYLDMVDSPTSDYAPSLHHHDLGNGSRQPQPLPGFNPQGVSASTSAAGTVFPALSHRSSAASFSSGSRAFDSPTLEQQGSYPWNVSSGAATNTAGIANSPSWNDDMSNGYGYDSPTSAGPYGGSIGHTGGFDPQFISQYGQQQQQQNTQQQQQQQQQQSQHNQGGSSSSTSSSYRNNYNRRHSDKPVHLDYQMCVDRILQATDQQASIHLQQKLKTSPPEQKVQIIDAILLQAFPLMSNRFGNFLIQRCFEFGSPSQIDALAQAMRGNILTLACDPFGCHVVQKALDNVQEDAKARIVTEMFRRIRETIVHRYACHVWQKVFEIRWTDAPPAVMTYVNSAVAGRWAGVAVDETGSLVVQNIFENCAEHDKRPVLNEILQSVTLIAKGQWGNWVIQHILEHGSPTDRATVTQKILEDAVNLSLDQYASKVVEKTLRMAANPATLAPAAALPSANNSTSPTIAATATSSAASSPPPAVTIHGSKTIRLTQEEVMGQYIHIVCDGVQDRPRIPLIDIAADQYGNYIVQYILTHAAPQHREICAALIKRHMVSLRGSKYGQKVAFMVERWRGSPFSNTEGGSSSGGGSRSGGNGSNGGNGGERGTYAKSSNSSGSDGHERGHGNGEQRSGGGRRRW